MDIDLEKYERNILSPKQQNKLFNSLTPQYQIQQQQLIEQQKKLKNIRNSMDARLSISQNSIPNIKKPLVVQQKQFHHHPSNQHQYNNLSKQQKQYILGDQQNEFSNRRNTFFVNLLDNEHMHKDAFEHDIQIEHSVKFPKLNLVSQFQNFSSSSTQPFTTPQKSILDALQEINHNNNKDPNDSGILTPRSVHEDEVKLGHKEKMKNYFKREEIHKQLRAFKFPNNINDLDYDRVNQIKKLNKNNSKRSTKKITRIISNEQQNQKNDDKNHSHRPKFTKLDSTIIKPEDEIKLLCKQLLNQASEYTLRNNLTLIYQLKTLEILALKLKQIKGQRTLKALLDQICSYSKKITELLKNIQLSPTDFICQHQQILKRIVELGLVHTTLPNGTMETKFVSDDLMFESIIDVSQKIEEQLVQISQTDILTKRIELIENKKQLQTKEKNLRRTLANSNPQQRYEELNDYYNHKYTIDLNLVDSNLNEQVKAIESKLGNFQFVSSLQRGYSQNINVCVNQLKKEEAKLQQILY